MNWKEIEKPEAEFANLKKLVGSMGIKKFPAGTKFSDYRIEWRKRGGYAGKKAIRNMEEQLEAAGWKQGNGTSGISPDGSYAGNGDEYVSPDGRVVASMYSYYGVTSYENSYYITFKARDNVSESGKWRLVREAFDFGFKVGDMVELVKGKENLVTGEVIEAGTVGEVVAVDKPMRGLCKVKIDGKVANIPSRSLKKQGDDEPEWMTRARAQSKPPAKHEVEPEKPEHYYMRPTSYGSPRYTGD